MADQDGSDRSSHEAAKVNGYGTSDWPDSVSADVDAAFATWH